MCLLNAVSIVPPKMLACVPALCRGVAFQMHACNGGALVVAYLRFASEVMPEAVWKSFDGLKKQMLRNQSHAPDIQTGGRC